MRQPDFNLDINYYGKKMYIKSHDLHFSVPHRTDLVFFIDEKTGCIVEFQIINENIVVDPFCNEKIYGEIKF